LPGSDQIPGELIQACGETLHSEIHKIIKFIWNKEELSHQWKKSIVIPIHKKDDKTDCGDYQGISLLSNSYKILYNILVSRPLFLKMWSVAIFQVVYSNLQVVPEEKASRKLYQLTNEKYTHIHLC
jgi:hypothetical protein